jgi:adenine-specific DNA-methyltransferase
MKTGTKVAMKGRKEKGQYFTISADLQQFVFDKVKHKGATLLEPSFGAGHLLQKFKEFDENYPMDLYELDATIQPIIPFHATQHVIYGDFTTQTITRTYKTIIGNPPYVKQSTGNLYIKFIELCYSLLDPVEGELIFIVPSDFMKLTSAASLIDTMVQHGTFTDFYFPNNEKLFEGANIDVVVFRYEKGAVSKETRVNGERRFCNVQQGILTFHETEPSGRPLMEVFNVYVGLVSGKEEVYRVPFGNIKLLNDKDRVDTYIFTTAFPTQDETINGHLLQKKGELLERKIRKFDETNWFEWGAPRNLKAMEAHLNKPCIYVRNMTRQKEVAFLGTVQYFGGSLLCLIPKKEMTEAELKKTVDVFNRPELQKDYIYAGRFKIGHKQVSNILL